jgi:hypothetical protein
MATSAFQACPYWSRNLGSHLLIWYIDRFGLTNEFSNVVHRDGKLVLYFHSRWFLNLGQHSTTMRFLCVCLCRCGLYISQPFVTGLAIANVVVMLGAPVSIHLSKCLPPILTPPRLSIRTCWLRKCIPQTKSSFNGMCFRLQGVLHSVFTCRIIINIRVAGKRGSDKMPTELHTQNFDGDLSSTLTFRLDERSEGVTSQGSPVAISMMSSSLQV